MVDEIAEGEEEVQEVPQVEEEEAMETAPAEEEKQEEEEKGRGLFFSCRKCLFKKSVLGGLS